MNSLGVLLAARLDPPDLDQARNWYQQAADAGNSYATDRLSLLEDRNRNAPRAAE
jgi:TPR repeat protein